MRKNGVLHAGCFARLELRPDQWAIERRAIANIQIDILQGGDRIRQAGQRESVLLSTPLRVCCPARRESKRTYRLFHLLGQRFGIGAGEPNRRTECHVDMSGPRHVPCGMEHAIDAHRPGKPSSRPA